MHRDTRTVIRRVSDLPSSVIAWINGASIPCSGELLIALDALWKRDPVMFEISAGVHAAHRS